ncbi:MAG: double-strand break repair protein AddB [Pseudomonadota bacterium]
MTRPDLFSASTATDSPPHPNVYSIDAGRPFLRALATGVLDRYGAAPEDLARIEIYVPTRRAARALADAFLDAVEDVASSEDRSGVTATLLPQIKTLGDVDADLIDAFAPSAMTTNLPPAAAPGLRLLALARFVAAKDRAFNGAENWPAALAAASELAKLLDSLYTEEIPSDRLADAAPAEHAEHWAQSLAFLQIITAAWPDYLKAADLLDPAARRMALIDVQTAHWRETSPKGPIIIAGSTGSAPAVARLMGVVAGFKDGAVVLPGLDRALDARAWETVDDGHPQAGLKYLLEKLACTPQSIRPWREESTDIDAPRARLLSLVLRPADATDEWRARAGDLLAGDPSLENALSGLRMIEAEEEEDEATAIALLFRETLEEPDKTALLVTPDRFLARRVSLKMRRWGVDIDDSAGVPFASSPCGAFLRIVAEWLAAPGDPGLALSLARHPLARFGLEAEQKHKSLAAFDKAMRGVAPTDRSLAALRAKVDAHLKDDSPSARRLGDVEDALVIVDALAAAAAPWEQLAANNRDALNNADLAARLEAHLAAAEAIASDANEEAAANNTLWRGDDGEAGAAYLADLRLSLLDAAADGGALVLPEHDYPSAFTGLIGPCAVRRRRPAHPRLAILGPLEARLQQADYIILGGLNEGVWPADAGGDPFLSRPMRASIGLPSPERRLGLAAHDFAALAAAPNVVLTRSKKAGGAPAKPSRWLVRLKTILRLAAPDAAIDVSSTYNAWAGALDAAGAPTPVKRPVPQPPVAARPRRLSVTRIEKWLRDPYAIYARDILGLYPMEPPGGAFSVREMGELLHGVFETAAAAPDAPTADALAQLFDERAQGFGCTDADAALWRPALQAAFHWFTDFDAERRATSDETFLEAKGEIELPNITPPFTLYGRADRLDIDKTGAALLVDYKSAEPKSEKQAKFFNPQLQLLGLIAEQGGFDAIGPRPVADYRYVRMINRRGQMSRDEQGQSGEAAHAAILDAAERLAALITAFDDPARGYPAQPHPEFTDVYGDYDQLSRRGEWGALGNDGGEA